MKQNCSLSLLTGASLLGLALADWQFRSRPDLSPPKLNITINATEDVEKGFLFIAPFAGFPDKAGEMHGPRQAAPYIFRDNGDLVWSGYGYFSIWATNFQTAKLNGENVLFSFEGDHNAGYGHGHGHTTFLNQNYELVRELRAGNHKLTDKHEFHVIGETTGLIQVYQPIPADLTAFGGGPDQQWIVDAIFQELDISTGELLFEWSSLAHVSPHEAILPLNPGQAGSGHNSSDAWDYFHINSVDKDDEGNYLISARDACSVHKINGSTGEIIWKLDGKDSSFELGENATFCFQHHARYISKDTDEEVSSLYDNSAHGSEDGRGREVKTAPTSSGKLIKLDTKTWRASLVQGFYPPDDLLSKSQGSTQLLPNGNVLVNWGSEGALTEFRPDGTPIFHTYMDSNFLGEGVENYRGFRYNWTGFPNEEPAIVALRSRDGAIRAYVSWNGDTETESWHFYGVLDTDEPLNYLGYAKRISFETVFELREHVRAGRIVAVAHDVHGRTLVRTGPTDVIPEILPFPASYESPVVTQDQQYTTSNWQRNMILKYSKLGAKNA